MDKEKIISQYYEYTKKVADIFDEMNLSDAQVLDYSINFLSSLINIGIRENLFTKEVALFNIISTLNKSLEDSSNHENSDNRNI